MSAFFGRGTWEMVGMTLLCRGGHRGSLSELGIRKLEIKGSEEGEGRLDQDDCDCHARGNFPPFSLFGPTLLCIVYSN